MSQDMKGFAAAGELLFSLFFFFFFLMSFKYIMYVASAFTVSNDLTAGCKIAIN